MQLAIICHILMPLYQKRPWARNISDTANRKKI